MQERYIRNIGAVSAAGFSKAQQATVAVVGCGGLGGYVIEALARFGVGRLLLIDSGTFEESNLNRQRFCFLRTLGQSKVHACAHELADINPDVTVDAMHAQLDSDSAQSLLHGADIVADCLDNIPARLALEDACAALQVPLVHGAVHGLCGQVGLISPGEGLLHTLYRDMPTPLSSPSVLSCAVQATAALMATELTKAIAGEGQRLSPGLLMVDLSDMQFRHTHIL